MTAPQETQITDLFVIGGGINGCGIARDAAGRGLSVTLAERGDLAQATSSASTKLFHGGLRYLEYFEFRLVREALIERETLLRAMPHISWPLRFVLPWHADMRFESDTPTSRLLSGLMPWMRGRRPAWLLRLGLHLYDHLGGRQILPAARRLDLRRDPAGAPLQDRFVQAFEYSDCWIDDSRLVVLNARDAAARGAEILTRARVRGARVENGLWVVTLETAQGRTEERRARALVNAAGPWVGAVLGLLPGADHSAGVRLVRGSHIVTRRLFDHDRAYFFQGTDGRIIFAIPYENDFTLIGTTDAEHDRPDHRPECTPAERRYLIDFANQYLRTPVSEDDIVWTYSGVRPLYDDGAKSATAATRDYVLRLDTRPGAPLLNVFGGKITTYRRLAESALAQLRPHVGGSGRWTARVALPGGDFPVNGVVQLTGDLRARYPFLTGPWAARLVRSYGTDAFKMLGNARSAADLGPDFGATLTARELDWLRAAEFAVTAEDVIWRRSKLGLRLTHEEVRAIDAYLARRAMSAASAAE